jgi:hypothetical protein
MRPTLTVAAGQASEPCQWYPLDDVRPFSGEKLVAPHEFHLSYRPAPEAGPAKASYILDKFLRNRIGEPNDVRVRQVAGYAIDDPFAARLVDASLSNPSEVTAHRVKSLVLRKYLGKDGGRGEVEPPHGEVERGIGGCDVAQLGEAGGGTGIVGRELPQLTDGHVHGVGWVVMMVRLVVMQLFEGGRYRRRNA